MSEAWDKAAEMEDIAEQQEATDAAFYDRVHPEDLAEARESLGILEETERFLLEHGASGKLTLETTGRWADELATCRGMIASQRRVVARLQAELKIGRA